MYVCILLIIIFLTFVKKHLLMTDIPAVELLIITNNDNKFIYYVKNYFMFSNTFIMSELQKFKYEIYNINIGMARRSVKKND